MIKILHSADWHLDSPLLLQNPDQTRHLRQALAGIPEKVTAICRAQGCDLMLLSGDLLDGAASADTLRRLKTSLAEAAVPVFITPGNHDYAGVDSPWLTEVWPDNVHIFTRTAIESVALPALDCRVYGAGFTAMDCPGLLEGFTARQAERYAIGIFHGDPTQIRSPYCPITTAQVKASSLDYLALGHIHKGDRFTAGKTLCAWPGCPMGRGYDELGQKGLLLVTLEETATAEFIPLDSPQFHDIDITADQSLSQVLPPVGNGDFYRITFIGPSEPMDLSGLRDAYPQFPNLELRDRTTPPLDVWSSVGEDSFEGMYFRKLRDALETADPDAARQIRLAAQISRKILEGQEVILP